MAGPLGLQAGLLAAIAVLSYLGDGWGYLVVYGFLLFLLVMLIAALDLTGRLRPSCRGARRNEVSRSPQLRSR